MARRIIVLHSGGLDSTVCLLQGLELGYEVTSLGINYNQKHAIELQFAEAHCRHLNISRKVINVAWDKPVRTIPTGRTVEEIRQGVSVAFLEGRNIVFLSIACAEAAGLGADEVWLGVNAVDYSGYPDCRPEFINAFSKMLEIGFPNGPEIKTPLINLTKPQIAAEGNRLRLRRNDTWSCYRPELTGRGIEPCGKCDACVLHNLAWQGITETNAPLFINFSFR